MNKMNSLHHIPKISIFLQFESHNSKCFKVRGISDLRDLYGNKIQGLTRRKYWYHSKDPVQISTSVTADSTLHLDFLMEQPGVKA